MTVKKPNLALGALLLTVTALAWMSVVRDASAPMAMSHDTRPWSAAAAAKFTLQWGVMMAAMMLPSATPMILLYGAISRRAQSGGRVIPAELFAAVYVALWLMTGVPVYLASVWTGAIMMRSSTATAAIPLGIAATLFTAGVYQLTPAKHACLQKCERPLDFLMRRWKSGYSASFKLASAHALFCIGCCWALMLLLVVVGAMSLPWVLAIALLVFAEKVLPWGSRTAKATGIIMIIGGVILATRFVAGK